MINLLKICQRKRQRQFFNFVVIKYKKLMNRKDNQSYYQVLDRSSDNSQDNQWLRHQVQKLALENKRLQQINKNLTIQIKDKEIKMMELAFKTREMSKALMRFSILKVTNQEFIASKQEEIKVSKTRYQTELGSLIKQKQELEKLLAKLTILFNKQKKENQKLQLQLDSISQRKQMEIKSAQIIVQQKQKYEKIQRKLEDYKQLVKIQSEQNMNLEYKVIDLQAQVSFRIKKQNNQKNGLKKYRSDIIQK